jgi:tellurite resistance protein
MPDLVVRHIDNVMAERIKTLAKDRRWSINDVVLHALKHGLGLAEGAQPFAETMLDTDTVVLSGHWDAAERAAFHEAVQALSVAPSSQLLAPPEDILGEAPERPADRS